MATSDPTTSQPATPAWPTIAPKKRTPRALVAGVALLVAGGVGWGAWAFTHRKAAVTFTTTPVETGDIASKITASGALAAVRTVDVGSQVSGRIASLYVDYNSPVKKGQVLARLDTQLLVAAKEQAQANYRSAEAAVRRAQAQAAVAQRESARLATLARGEFIATSELDTGRTNAEVARTQTVSALAALEQAKASVRQANVNLEFAAILSPIDGVVISRAVSVGQTVAASLQSPVLFVLAQDLKKLEVHAAVAESDVGRLKPGMPTEFTVDAYPGVTFPGKVRQIRNQPTTLQNVVTYDTVVDVSNPDGRLKIGMTANVSFIEASHEDILRVPNAALRYQPSEAAFPRGEGRARGGAGRRGAEASASPAAVAEKPAAGEAKGEGRRKRGPRVWVQTGDTIRPVRIATGLTDGAFTEVEGEELKEGDLVVTDDSGNAGGAAAPAGGQQRGGGGNRRRGGPGLF